MNISIHGRVYRVVSESVVDAARPDESPLHPCFEWDDVRAAELFREDQARHVISSVRVVQRSDDPRKEARVMHAFVSLIEQVGDEEQRAYVPMARVFADSELLKQAIERAAAELRAFEDRYREFDAIARAVKVARESIETTAQAA